MRKIRPLRVARIDEFIKALATIMQRLLSDGGPARKLEQPQLWYRGQQCTEWGLSPKLYRPEFRGAQEAELRVQFQSRALQLIGGRPPQDKWSWYFLMQHYGCPTRLLDWTDSPLLGLFFALHWPVPSCHIHKNGHCDKAVWILNPWRLNERTLRGVDGPILSDWEEADDYLIDLERAFDREQSTDFNARKKRPAALDPPHLDRRIAVQGSHFVIFAREKDLSRIGPTTLQKIVIPFAESAAVRDELETLGINVATVFPDLDHLGEFLRGLARNTGKKSK